MSDPCEGCGLCCKGLILEISHVDVVREPKLEEVAEVLMADPFVPADEEGNPVNPWDRQYMLPTIGEGRDGCPMLCGDRCSIHPTRPNMCVLFQVGGRKCNELREGAGLDALPPPEFTWDEDDEDD